MVAEIIVIDASAIVDVLVGSPLAGPVVSRARGHELHAPAHLDAEVLSALGRLHRGGHLTAEETAVRIERLAAAPIERHPLPHLLVGAWRRRHDLRLVDAIYAELAVRLGAPVVTTDASMAAASDVADLVDHEV